jgi:hypothetical protein
VRAAAGLLLVAVSEISNVELRLQHFLLKDMHTAHKIVGNNKQVVTYSVTGVT